MNSLKDHQEELQFDDMDFMPRPRIQATAISPLLRHVMIYAVFAGIFFGIIGQFASSYFLKSYLQSVGEISQDFAWRLIAVELIILAVILIILIAILSFRWISPSRRAKFVHGFLIGGMFAITSYVVCVSSINGILHNRFQVGALDNLEELVWAFVQIVQQ